MLNKIIDKIKLQPIENIIPYVVVVVILFLFAMYGLGYLVGVLIALR